MSILRFDEAKVLLGVDVSDDADEVARHRQWRVAAWKHAVPHAEYLKNR